MKRPFRYRDTLAIPLRLTIGTEPEKEVERLGAFLARFTELYQHFAIELSDPDRDEKLARKLAERHEAGLRLEWLFERHGVDAENYFNLALILAMEHVPCFRMTHPGYQTEGRTPKFKVADMISIFIEVIKLKNANISEREACKQIASSERWQDYTHDEIRECWKEAKAAARNLVEDRLTGNQYHFLRFFWKRMGEN